MVTSPETRDYSSVSIKKAKLLEKFLQRGYGLESFIQQDGLRKNSIVIYNILKSFLWRLGARHLKCIPDIL